MENRLSSLNNTEKHCQQLETNNKDLETQVKELKTRVRKLKNPKKKKKPKYSEKSKDSTNTSTSKSETSELEKLTSNENRSNLSSNSEKTETRKSKVGEEEQSKANEIPEIIDASSQPSLKKNLKWRSFPGSQPIILPPLPEVQPLSMKSGPILAPISDSLSNNSSNKKEETSDKTKDITEKESVNFPRISSSQTTNVPIPTSSPSSSSAPVSSTTSSSAISNPSNSSNSCSTSLNLKFNKKKRGKLPEPSITILKNWLFDHWYHPYPSEEEKGVICTQTNLSMNQINNWFTNARRRILPKKNTPQSAELTLVPLPPQVKSASYLHSQRHLINSQKFKA